MKIYQLLFFILLSLIANIAISGDFLDLEKERVKYVCPPCFHVDRLFNTEEYMHDGQCAICGMNLIEKNTLSQPMRPLIHRGDGNFVLSGGLGKQASEIVVFYHKPEAFNKDTRVLIVVPGAGRNAWDYRDSWVKASERNNVLILVPSYSKESYDYAAYHLAGIVSSIEFINLPQSKSGEVINKYHLKDEDIKLGLMTESKLWLFKDFDRIFQLAKKETGLVQTGYDIFGHSAGAQILHRMALFYPESQVDRIIAANSGSYTIPNTKHNYPFGLYATKLEDNDLKKAFSSKLVLLLGKQDDVNETRGTMLHTPIVDEQGLGRYSRGNYFFHQAEIKASEIGAQFDWIIETVVDVGHDYKGMGKAAEKLLYGKTNHDFK